MVAVVGAAAAVISAGAAVYGGMQSSKNAKAANATQQANIAMARSQNIQNTLRDTIAGYGNQRQQELDNQRYDTAVGKEDAQRALINKLATATQIDAQGNRTGYDPLTATWSTNPTGVATTNRARGETLNAIQYDQALLEALGGGSQAPTDVQRTEGALGQEMLAQYASNRGRSPEAFTAAQIEANVAGVMDPLQRNAERTLLAGYRQGNSGNDALLGALARNGAGGTRSAIANARLSGPVGSLNESDAYAKGVLGPATTLNSRAEAESGDAPTVFSGDTSSNALASVNRGNPAGVGSTVNPIRGMQAVTNSGRMAMPEYKPLNASGNEANNIAAAFSGLVNNNDVRALGQKLSDWWSPPEQPPYRQAAATRSNSGWE